MQCSFVRNKSVHIKNSETISCIIKDIETNRLPYIATPSSSRVKQENSIVSEDKVIIVRGHDDGLKNEVAKFLEKLGIKSVILQEQVSAGQTIIEKKNIILMSVLVLFYIHRVIFEGFLANLKNSVPGLDKT